MVACDISFCTLYRLIWMIMSVWLFLKNVAPLVFLAEKCKHGSKSAYKSEHYSFSCVPIIHKSREITSKYMLDSYIPGVHKMTDARTN